MIPHVLGSWDPTSKSVVWDPLYINWVIQIHKSNKEWQTAFTDKHEVKWLTIKNTFLKTKTQNISHSRVPISMFFLFWWKMNLYVGKISNYSHGGNIDQVCSWFPVVRVNGSAHIGISISEFEVWSLLSSVFGLHVSNAQEFNVSSDLKHYSNSYRWQDNV